MTTVPSTNRVVNNITIATQTPYTYPNYITHYHSHQERNQKYYHKNWCLCCYSNVVNNLVIGRNLIISLSL